MDILLWTICEVKGSNHALSLFLHKLIESLGDSICSDSAQTLLRIWSDLNLVRSEQIWPFWSDLVRIWSENLALLLPFGVIKSLSRSAQICSEYLPYSKDLTFYYTHEYLYHYATSVWVLQNYDFTFFLMKSWTAARSQGRGREKAACQNESFIFWVIGQAKKGKGLTESGI